MKWFPHCFAFLAVIAIFILFACSGDNSIPEEDYYGDFGTPVSPSDIDDPYQSGPVSSSSTDETEDSSSSTNETGDSSSSTGGAGGSSSSAGGAGGSSSSAGGAGDSSSNSGGVLCGSMPYNTTTQFCYSNSKIGTYCGTRTTETDTYNPDLYECKPAINPNGIYLKTPVSYQNESYEAVLIGSQTWLARNLNYDTTSARCYKTLTDSLANCITYGKLYNSATAMRGASASTNNPSGVQGICPTGWHLPSKAEWEALRTTIGTNNNPGIKLKKSTSLWTNGNNGTDDYGFAALPGGRINSSNESKYLGTLGRWKSTTASGSNYETMVIDSTVSASGAVSALPGADYYSVRCVKNP